MRPEAARRKFLFWPGDAVRVESVQAIPSDRWSLLSIRHNGSGKASGLDIYVNGIAVAKTVERDQLTREGLYRRSLYTFWKRTSPPPSMLTFDATSRENCTAQRELTTTPLQALVLLNDPQYVEAARVLSGASILLESRPAARSRRRTTPQKRNASSIFFKVVARLSWKHGTTNRY